MSEETSSQETPPEKSFEELSREQQPGLIAEFLQFIVENKIWWMMPIILVLALVGLLAFLTSTGAAPFIYTLF